MAVALAPRDKTSAYALIDRALALCLEKPMEFRTCGLGLHGPGAVAALLSVQAGEIAYPDMQSVINRVLASRSNSPIGRHEDEYRNGKIPRIARSGYCSTDSHNL